MPSVRTVGPPSAIKNMQEALGHKVMFLDYPSVGHIRFYFPAVVNAYLLHWGMDWNWGKKLEGDWGMDLGWQTAWDGEELPDKYLNNIAALTRLRGFEPSRTIFRLFTLAK